MDDFEYFYIKGTRTLTFRKEDEDFYVYDPVSLEGLKLNYTAACILYLVSKNTSFTRIIVTLSEWFEFDKYEMEKIVVEYLRSFPLLPIIIVNLIELGVPINGQ